MLRPPPQPVRTRLYGSGGLGADVYDLQTALVSTECNGDIAFYREIIPPGASVLELGAGTGRICWPLAEAGYRMTGLDLSAAMLNIAEGKRVAYAPEVSGRVVLVQGDMTAFSLDCRFDVILAPFRSFNQLLTDDQARGCLESMHRHVDAQGFALLHMMRFPEAAPPGFDQRPDEQALTVPFADGSVLSIAFLRQSLDMVTRVWDLELEYVYRDAAGQVLRHSQEHWKMRAYAPDHFRALAALAGWNVRAAYGDFNRAPFTMHGEQIWLLEPELQPRHG